MSKICSKCKRNLTGKHYDLRPDGRLKASCRACHAALCKAWQDANPDKKPDVAAHPPVDRQQRKREACPPWYDKCKTMKLKYQRDALSELTGITFTLDHVIPLIHHLVCGLNIDTNIQILSQAENSKKSHTFNPRDYDYVRNHSR
jgi:hypothetical protein